jgi:hypothetical protein
LSVTFTVKVGVTALSDGVPEMIPVRLGNVSPWGTEPEDRRNVSHGLPTDFAMGPPARRHSRVAMVPRLSCASLGDPGA